MLTPEMTTNANPTATRLALRIVRASFQARRLNLAGNPCVEELAFQAVRHAAKSFVRAAQDGVGGREAGRRLGMARAWFARVQAS